MPHGRPLLTSVAPEFARELTAALTQDGLAELAGQVSHLEIWDVCGCEDEFCGSFYVGAKPDGTWAQLGEYSTVAPDVAAGMVFLDVVDDVIRYVEVLDRPELAEVLEGLR